MSRYPFYVSLGFLFNRSSTDFVADYIDFVNLQWTKEDLTLDLKYNNLPTGLLLRYPNGHARVVAGTSTYLLTSDLRPISCPFHLTHFR